MSTLRKLLIDDAQQVRSTKSSFMDFWKALNDELTLRGVREAFFADAHDMFNHWRPVPSPAEAALQLMRVRGDA